MLSPKRSISLNSTQHLRKEENFVLMLIYLRLELLEKIKITEKILRITKIHTVFTLHKKFYVSFIKIYEKW